MMLIGLDLITTFLLSHTCDLRLQRMTVLDPGFAAGVPSLHISRNPMELRKTSARAAFVVDPP